eukprot:106443_1
MGCKYFCYILLVNALSIVSNATYYAYVSSDGEGKWGHSECSLSNPCPTLYQALNALPFNTRNNEDIILTVNGANRLWVDEIFNVGQGVRYCTDSVQLSGYRNITIIFNTSSITKTDDFFPRVDECTIEYSYPYYQWDVDKTPLISIYSYTNTKINLKVYNLVWNWSRNFLVSADHSSFYCENCVFRDINIGINTYSFGYPMFSLGGNVTFYNCLFENIHSTTSFIDIGYQIINQFSIKTATYPCLNISHCTFRNILGANIITFPSVLNSQKSLNIENSKIFINSIG